MGRERKRGKKFSMNLFVSLIRDIFLHVEAFMLFFPCGRLFSLYGDLFVYEEPYFLCGKLFLHVRGWLFYHYWDLPT